MRASKCLGAAVALLACTIAEVPTVARSPLPRDEQPLVSTADAQAVTKSVNDLGNDLLRLRAEERPTSNLVLSPYGISSALAMTYAGARGQTATEMAHALHYGTSNPALSKAFDALDLSFARRATDDSHGFVTHVANGIWGQQTYVWEPAFLDLLATDFGVGVHLVDFELQAEHARTDINAWVLAQTGGRIKDLLPVGSIEDLTRIVLVNAIALQARWVSPFPQAVADTFHLADGSTITTPMMHARLMAGYADRGDYEVVTLPFQDTLDGSRWSASLVLFVPKTGRWPESETWFESNILSGEVHDTTLSMPKFSIPPESFSIADELKTLGMPHAFGNTADFSGMTQSAQIQLTDVIHQATITVDEQGVEAAAGTAVIGGLVSLPPVATVIIDRPFYFIVRDELSGTALFVGRVVHP